MPTLTGRQQIALGPFNRGMNLKLGQYSMRSGIGYARWINNMDPKPDGSLEARRGFRKVGGSNNNAGSRFDLLGIRQNTDGTSHAIIGKVDTSGTTTFILSTSPEYNGGLTAPGLTQTGEFTASVFYNDLYWNVPRSGSTGLGFSCSGLFSGSPITRSAIPTGDTGFIWKDRLWVIDFASRTVNYSKATDPSTYTVPDGGFFKVPPQSDRKLTTAFVDRDTLYIFQIDAVWAFSYTSDPGSDGYLRLINSSQGAFSSLQYESKNYIVNRNGVYEFINGNFVYLSDALNKRFLVSDSLQLGLSVNNRMLIVSSTDSASVDIDADAFAMNIDTGAWTAYNVSPMSVSIGPRGKGLEVYDGSYRRTLWACGNLLAFSRSEVIDPTAEFPIYDYDGSSWYSPVYEVLSNIEDMSTPTEWKKVHSIQVMGDSGLESNASLMWGLWTDKKDAYPYFPNQPDTFSNDTQIRASTVASEDKAKTLLFPPFRARMFGVGFTKGVQGGYSSNTDYYIAFNQFLANVTGKRHLSIQNESSWT